MKTTTLLFASIVLLLSCKNNNQQAQPKNTDLVQRNLKGAVQHTIETPYKADSTGNTIAMDSCCVETYELNDSGYITKYTSKNDSNITNTEQTLIHYPNGAMKDITIMNNGKFTNRVTPTIDENGNYTGGMSYDSTSKQDGYYTDMKQNDFGELTNGKLYKMDSTLKYHFEENYDNKGQYLGGRTDSAGKVIYTNITTLDSSGNPVKMITTTMVKDSAKNDTTLYRYDKYDEQGNWIQRTTLTASGKPTKITKREITYYKKQ